MFKALAVIINFNLKKNYRVVELSSVTGVLCGPIENPVKSKSTETVPLKGKSIETAIHLCVNSSDDESNADYFASEDDDGRVCVDSDCYDDHRGKEWLT
jgi:hypothetical protein